jgi:hypothetical protein
MSIRICSSLYARAMAAAIVEKPSCCSPEASRQKMYRRASRISRAIQKGDGLVPVTLRR